ncbi:Phosphatidylinositol 5-phosphate 4-kinase type-2 alpha [Phlyctochytrium planicorne]|nr:Phosphatidylinositol 5-phosphate 4-kinase type-2 alpha [Phlyctochytrium planicorne]
MLRKSFGYSTEAIRRSLSNPCLAELTEGKSESVFLKTSDGKFLFKTVRGNEADNLKHILPDYLAYCQKNHDTFLPKYLGLYSFEIVSRPSSGNFQSSYSSLPTKDDAILSALTRHFTVVLMANVFDSDLPIHRKFDFKGSAVGRQTLAQISQRGFKGSSMEVLFGAQKLPENHCSESPSTPSSPTPYLWADAPNDADAFQHTLKELDFERLLGSKRVNLISLGPERKSLLLKQIQSDIEFLKQFGLMDYSVLIGVYRKQRERQNAFPQSEHQGLSTTVRHENPRPLSLFRIFDHEQPPQHNLVPMSRSNSLASQTQAATQRSQSQCSFSSLPSRRSSVSSVFREQLEDRESQDKTRGLSLFSSMFKSRCSTAIHEEEELLSQSMPAPSGFKQALFGEKRSPHRKMEDPARTTYGTLHGQPKSFGRSFKGGIKSCGIISDDIEHEVYFIGIIDSLQRFNFSKWLERGIQKQRQIFSPKASIPTSPGREIETPKSLAGLFQSSPTTPARSSSSVSFKLDVSEDQETAPFVMSEQDRNEISVEEPGRYAKRLLDFLDRVIV